VTSEIILWKLAVAFGLPIKRIDLEGEATEDRSEISQTPILPVTTETDTFDKVRPWSRPLAHSVYSGENGRYLRSRTNDLSRNYCTFFFIHVNLKKEKIKSVLK